MDTEEQFAREVDSRVIQRSPTDYDVKWTHKRRPVPSIEVAGILAERLVGYSQMKSDLEDALAWIGEAEETLKSESANNEITGLILDTSNARRARGLFVAALVSYGKCFAQAKGRRSRLNKRQLAQRFHLAHDYFDSMRDAYAAHSGAEKFERSRLFLLIHPKYKRNGIVHLRVEGSKPILHIAAPDETLFEELIRHSLEVTHRKKMEVRTSILEGAVRTKGLAYWVALCKRKAKEILPVT